MTNRYELVDTNVHKPEGGIGVTYASTINIKCPHCGHLGTFSQVRDINDAEYYKKIRVTRPDGRQVEGSFGTQIAMGLRQCPNLECLSLVTVVYRSDENKKEVVLWVSPPELIDFRVDKIPAKICSSMKEAIASHSVGAHRASALMVRRTLELLCEDKAVTGKNLMEKIKNLGAHATLPAALLEAADHLRLLGNDAAHVEAKNYDDIDKDHAEVAIDVAKEILKAVYQHDDLVARLNRLRKS